jgi:hypothetical protein
VRPILAVACVDEISVVPSHADKGGSDQSVSESHCTAACTFEISVCWEWVMCNANRCVH